MNSNDAVFYSCDNEDFEDFITKEFYKTSFGSFSDISVIAPFIGCAAVNLSCGYYNAHQKTEYVVVEEMAASIEAACRILERTTEDDKFEYVEAKYPWYSGGNSYFSNRFGYGCYDFIEDEEDFADINSFRSNKTSSKSYSDEYYFLIEYVDINNTIQWWELYAASEDAAVGKFLTINPDLTYNDIIDICSDEDCCGH